MYAGIREVCEYAGVCDAGSCSEEDPENVPILLLLVLIDIVREAVQNFQNVMD